MALSWKPAYMPLTAAYTNDIDTVILWGLDSHDSSLQVTCNQYPLSSYLVGYSTGAELTAHILDHLVG